MITSRITEGENRHRYVKYCWVKTM